MHYAPDWFVTREWKDMWHDDYYKYCYDGDGEYKFFWWHEDYKKRKAQKASIKEELLPIAWHPLKWRDWCMSEHKKRDTEKLCR